jgi:hypothetical protein
MLDEQATVKQSTSGSVHYFVYKLGEPRALGWISVAFVLLTWKSWSPSAWIDLFAAPDPYTYRAYDDVPDR